MEEERPGMRLDDQDFAPPPHGRNPRPRQGLQISGPGRPQKLGEATPGRFNPKADDPCPQAGSDSFDFGEFGHPTILDV
jgi:hypothetical protein